MKSGCGSPYARDPPHRAIVPGHDGQITLSRCRRAAPLHLRPRRARAQSEERRRRPAARQAGGDHRPVGLGQVVARLRHDLCRGPAPLRREPVGLCPPVPRADAEARRRFDRGPVAGDLDRAEDDLAQSALDRRHGHRDLRLPAPAVRARRRALLAGHRPADREPDRVADGRPHHGDARRHAALPAGADRARPQGRVPQGAAGAAASKGFQRVKVDGKLYEIDEAPALDKKYKHDIEVVVDRIVVQPDLGNRLADSIETALEPGRGPRRRRERRQRRAHGLLGQASPARSRASPSRRSSRGCSPSTRRTAPARPATASA